MNTKKCAEGILEIFDNYKWSKKHRDEISVQLLQYLENYSSEDVEEDSIDDIDLDDYLEDIPEIGKLIIPDTTDKKQIADFENQCMDVIETVVGESQEYERKDAIKRAEELLKEEQAKSENEYSILVHQRVLQEFKRATDQEYNLLRKQIFEL